MTDPLDRGDMGAIPDPSWEERWSTWSIEAVQARIAEAATYGVLSKVQVIALLQGLPPPAKGSDPTFTVLAEFEAVVDRYFQDAERGQVSRTPTPQELAAWANAMGEALPEAFLVALEANPIKAGASRSGIAPGGETVELAPWAASLPNPRSPPAARRMVGRPKTTAADAQALTKAGRDILRAESTKGRKVTLIDICRALVGQPVAGAKSAETIKRLLTGKLDLEKARIKALRVSSKSRK